MASPFPAGKPRNITSKDLFTILFICTCGGLRLREIFRIASAEITNLLPGRNAKFGSYSYFYLASAQPMEILLATFSALFSVVNPFGAMPVFITLTQDDTPRHRNQMALQASMYMVLILAVFFFAGQYVLNFFGLRIHDLRIAGGIMLFKAGFDLLATKSEPGRKISKDVEEESIQKVDISFTPLAMPMLSGPGAIAVSIGMFTESLSYLQMGITLIAIILVAVASYFILISSPRLVRVMGKAGLSALSKIMGFITLAIGANFITSALIALFKA